MNTRSSRHAVCAGPPSAIRPLEPERGIEQVSRKPRSEQSSVEQVELPHVLDDESSVDRAHAVEALRVVVDDEESRGGGVEPVEPEVGGPALGPVVSESGSGRR